MSTLNTESTNLPMVVGAVINSARRCVILFLNKTVPATPRLFAHGNVHEDHPLAKLTRTLLSDDSSVDHIVALEDNAEIFFPFDKDFREMLCDTFGFGLASSIVDAQCAIIEVTNRMIKEDQQKA